MAPLSLLDVLVCGAVSLIFYRLSRWIRRPSSLPPPPGPPGLPIIGNLLDIPTEEKWIAYRRLREDYNSDLVRLCALGSEYVVINSLNVAVDLFDRRSAIYNDRPVYTMIGDLVGFGWAMPFVPYGKYLRDMRHAFHQGIGPEALKHYFHVEESAVHDLLARLYHSPELFMDHIRHMSGRIIMRLAYGIQVKEEDDPYITIAEEGLNALNAALGVGTFWVDILPVMRCIPGWFPGARFKRLAKQWRVPVADLVELPFETVKKQMESGQDLPRSVATVLFERMTSNSADSAYTESVIKTSLGSMYAGGADTSLSTVATFIMAMVLYPEVQAKAQEEIDRVIGSSRLPNFGDRSSLPYIEAIVRETLRLHPVVPINTPHRLSQDDEYGGYFLKKDTVLIVNTWGVLHDPNVYPDPDVFKPERFLKDGSIDPSTQDPAIACFGFGRRICPGRFLAKDSLWITVASLLATYNFSKAIGSDGEEIAVKEEYSSGLISYPEPFVCDIRPRSTECEALIKSCMSDD